MLQSTSAKKWLSEHPYKLYEYPLAFCRNWFDWLKWILILSTFSYIAGRTLDPIIWFILLTSYVALFFYFYFFFFIYSRWLAIFEKKITFMVVLNVSMTSFTISLGVYLLIDHILSILQKNNII